MTLISGTVLLDQPILQCLGDMRRLHVIGRGQVRDGPRHFEDAAVSAGAEAQALHSLFEEPRAARVEPAVAPKQAAAEDPPLPKWL